MYQSFEPRHYDCAVTAVAHMTKEEIEKSDSRFANCEECMSWRDDYFVNASGEVERKCPYCSENPWNDYDEEEEGC